MQITPVVIDSLVPYAPNCGQTSLLMLPMGTRTVGRLLGQRFRAACAAPMIVVPRFHADDEYATRIADCCPPGARVLDQDALAAMILGSETTDYLLITEARYWLHTGAEVVDLVDVLSDYRGISHAMAVGPERESSAEQIAMDDNSRVHRVRRLYNSQNRPELVSRAIAFTVAPARYLSGMRFASLADLRSRLSRGSALMRDLPIPGELLDLADEASFLALSEWAVSQATARRPAPGFRRRSPGVLVADSCSIDPDARLVGPLVIGGGVRIDRDAVLVGPALVGDGCRIHCNAVVAQSVLTPGTIVRARESIRHQVLAGCTDKRRCTAGNGSRSPADAQVRALPGSAAGSLSGWAYNRLPAARPVQQCIKRMVDLAVSASALVCLSPLLAIAAAMIKLDSSGPVFFRHRREGRNGREFPCLKFRTMQTEAHASQRQLYKDSQVDGPQFKIDHDPRVTRVGRWLRGTNIDELPQLWNVLLGQMSLVGPRPSPFRENQICVPWRQARLSVRPGITGLWQLGRDKDRSRGGFHEWIIYDLMYVQHFSLWLDLKIIVATALTLGGRFDVAVERFLPRRRQAGPGNAFHPSARLAGQG